MKLKLSHLAAAAAIAGFVGVGGISLAHAQETPSTTTPEEEAPSDTTPGTAPDDGGGTREGCDRADDGSGSSDPGSGSESGTSTAL